MPIRQRLVTYGFSTAAAATITVAALLQPWRTAPRESVNTLPFELPKHAVDVVFAVDTTGSMGGLIEGAKRTVWSIATNIRTTDPQADLRIGLVAYRDIGDDYVTRDFALTSDLDAVFRELSGYRAQGGGDTPEDVAAALNDTLHKMQWRDDAKKLVFLVGDAPPAPRGDAPPYDVLASEAGDRQIVLNTIRCGLDPSTEMAWQRIASLGRGQYSTIQQDGGVQQIATPYDSKLSELSAQIDGTTVIVGGDKERAEYVRNLAAARAASPEEQAARAAYYNAGVARNANDLLDGYESGAVAPEAVPQAALPEDLRGKDAPALRKELEKRVAERKAAKVKLDELTRERDRYLKMNAKPSDDAFDTKVNATLKAQLKR